MYQLFWTLTHVRLSAAGPPMRSVHKTLEAKGPSAALEMALSERGCTSKPLIHHSDRGVQYCSGAYVARLRDAGITISMTESIDPNENALAERVFRTLKHDFRLHGFINFGLAETAVGQAIQAYSSLRPHASLNYQTAPAARSESGPPASWSSAAKIVSLQAGSVWKCALANGQAVLFPFVDLFQ